MLLEAIYKYRAIAVAYIRALQWPPSARQGSHRRGKP